MPYYELKLLRVEADSDPQNPKGVCFSFEESLAAHIEAVMRKTLPAQDGIF